MEMKLPEETAGRIRSAIKNCYQCGRCSSACPAAYSMELLPHRVIRSLQAGLSEKVLNSDSIGLCLSCHTCSSRCPQGVDFAWVMGELKRAAFRMEGKGAESNQALFNRTFIDLIRYLGRIYEAGLIGIFNFRSRQFFKDFNLAPGMLRKRKLKLLPSITRPWNKYGKIFKWLKI